MLSVYRAIVKILCLLSYPFINNMLMQHNKKSSFRALLALYNIKLLMITVRVKAHPG